MELLFYDNFGPIDSFGGGGLRDMDLQVNVYMELGLRMKGNPDLTDP